jgi:epoxyqueuosine reductase
MIDDLIKGLEEGGIGARVVKIEHLAELEEAIAGPHRRGLFEETFFREELTRFRYDVDQILPGAHSIVIASVPQPIIGVSFEWGGEKLATSLPPTYVDADAIDARAVRAMDEILGPGRYHFKRAIVPRKTLAVRSGLASYGRNNITYVPGHGSFHRLVAFFSDLECDADQWRDATMLPACKTCQACAKACPNGAIAEERFIIRADRCLTYLNERAKEPFPAWVSPTAHHAIVGCLSCQIACPYNKKLLGWIEPRAEFSEDETRYLLAGHFEGPEAKAMEERLGTIGLDLTIFPRNLAALIASRDEPS